MQILMATSEAVPLAKTGGLADVCGALPGELARLGHDVAVIMPAYAATRRSGLAIEETAIELIIPIGAKTVRGKLLKTFLPGQQVPVYLVEQEGYFSRPGLYGENGQDYVDNCERFVFFSRCVMEAIRLLELRVDILHCHDWQSSLIPAYHKIEYRGLPGYDQLATVLTIHNLAYQGHFWHWDMLLTGIDWKYFNWHQMEFFGHLNLLKTGLVFADALTTVSPKYAEEIQTEEFGCGLEGVLQQRRRFLQGIINGVDYREWDPAHDPHLSEKYDVTTADAGKAACKRALQAKLKLHQRIDVPLAAYVGRLAEQKGIDLIAAAMERWIDDPLQWVILGSGDPRSQEQLARIVARAPDKMAVRFEFNNALAHQIEAAADLFVMPSRYEPCGLNQLYSLRYGAVPIVRDVGGLSDTITDVTRGSLSDGTATGFVVREHTPTALFQALRSAVETYAQGDVFRQIRENGMRQDWSWRRSAEDYASLYEQVLSRIRLPVMV